MTSEISADQIPKFMNKINKNSETGCWDWQGHVNLLGYGAFWCKLNGEAVVKSRQAHRISFLIKNGYLSPGMSIDHICRNKQCVNPEHLRQVTPRINTLENSIGPAVKNLNKTECINGHHFTDGNTYLRKHANGSTHRRCRECERLKMNKKRAMERLIIDIIFILENAAKHPEELKEELTGEWIEKAKTIIVAFGESK